MVVFRVYVNLPKIIHESVQLSVIFRVYVNLQEGHWWLNPSKTLYQGLVNVLIFRITRILGIFHLQILESDVQKFQKLDIYQALIRVTRLPWNLPEHLEKKITKTPWFLMIFPIDSHSRVYLNFRPMVRWISQNVPGPLRTRHVGDTTAGKYSKWNQAVDGFFLRCKMSTPWCSTCSTKYGV